MQFEKYREIPKGDREFEAPAKKKETKEEFREIKVAAIQMRSVPFEVEKNRDHAEELVNKAARDGAQLVVLPELFNVGYTWSRKSRKYAEDLEGETVGWMQKLSKDNRIYLAGAILEKEKKKFFDTMVLTTPEGKLYKYRKTHPFYPEFLALGRGKKPNVVETKIGKIGFMTCWDMMARSMSRYYKDFKGIDLLIISSSWPESKKFPILGKFNVLDKRSKELPLKIAKELGVPVIISNMAGEFDSKNPLIPMRSEFIANSRVISKEGEVKEKVSADREGIAMANIKIQK